MSRLKEVVFSGIFGLFVAVVIYMTSQTVLYWPFLNIQNKIDDSNFARRLKWKGMQGAETERIVIVDIDDWSIRSLGTAKSRRWPRRYLARVIGNLKRDGARLIFLDINLAEWNRYDRELADSTKCAGNVIAGYYFNLDRTSRNRRPMDSVYNIQFFENWLNSDDIEKNQFIRAQGIVLPYYTLIGSFKAIGFTNYIPDPDGILRHIPLYIAYGKNGRRASPSAALQMWLDLKDIHYSKASITPRGVGFGETFIPTDRHCFMRLNFADAGSMYRYYSFVDVLRGKYEPDAFKDKVVMIGSSAEEIGDLKRIPGHVSLPGVEIHAAALSTLLNESFLTVVSGNVIFIICILCGILSSVVFSFTRPFRVGLPIAIAVPLLMYLYGTYAFIFRSQLVNISLPSFIILFLYVIIIIYRFMEHYERKHLHHHAS